MRLYCIIPLSLLAVVLAGLQDKQEVHTQGCPKDCQKCTKAIEKGLRYLVSKQKKNGRWGMQKSPFPSQIVETALCGLALLSAGSTTTKGRYKDQLRRAVDFLKSRVKKSGRIGGKYLETWRVAFVGLFLAEVYRKDKCKDLKEKLVALKKRLEKLRRRTGGWGHGLVSSPRPIPLGPFYPADLVAATNLVVLAIKSLEGAGFRVKKRTIKRILKYYKMSQRRDGGFGYTSMPSIPPNTEPGRTAGAIYALLTLGKKKDDREIKKAIKYLKKRFSNISRSHGGTIHYLFGALASQRLGKGFWNDYIKIFYPVILRSQNKRGAFFLHRESYGLTEEVDLGPVFDTAISLIVLQMGKGNLSFIKHK